MANDGDLTDLQRLHQRQTALRQRLDAVGLGRRRVAVTGQIDRNGAVALARQRFNGGSKGEVTAIGVMQHEHGMTVAQCGESGKNRHVVI